MEGMIDLASFVNERVYEKSLGEKGVTLGFGMSQDKNTDSCRAIVRRTDHMATKTTSLQNAHAQIFNGQKMLTFPQACTGAAQRCPSSV